MRLSTKSATTPRLTKLPVGTFVVFGDEKLPEVHFIDERTRSMLADRERVADRIKAVEYTFGPGMQYALPAHSLDCMEFMALNYSGPMFNQVKGICACIALGKPFNPDPGGGTKVIIPPSPTKPHGPKGAANKLPGRKDVNRLTI